jgi:hypothetical protein
MDDVYSGMQCSRKKLVRKSRQHEKNQDNQRINESQTFKSNKHCFNTKKKK